MTQRHTVSPEHAPKFKEWIATRGGIAIWRSANLSNPGASWSSPARTPEGSPTPKPTWQASNEPERVITDASEIDVITAKEVKRFRVAVRPSSMGLSLKVTDAGTRRIMRETEKAGAQAWYEFDYSTQEAVIFVPDKTVPLSEWT